MDPRKYIYGIISILPGILQGAARSIADRIFSIFDDGVEFAVWLKSGFQELWLRASWGFYYVRAFAAEAVSTVTWAITIRVPQLISTAATNVRTWATGVINSAITNVKAIISTLDKWAKNAVSSVTNALNSVRDWLLGKINALTARITNTVDKWYDRLSSPTKFAEWLVGAMVGALFRYIYSQRDRIATWFLRSSPSFTEWLARELEIILRKII